MARADWLVKLRISCVKARLHRRFLSRQLDTSFIALKSQRVNHLRFSVRFVAVISQGFRTCLQLDATLARQKLHRVAATKVACVNGPLVNSQLRILHF